MSKISWTKLITALILTYAAGALGSIFTFNAIPTWYASLQKAPFNPPNTIFGPVWTILYTLMAIAYYLVWTQKKQSGKTLALSVFIMQLVLNTLWSLLFFGAHLLWLSYAEILLLLFFIALTIYYFWRFSKNAAVLMVPYLLWTGFASILNLFVAILNH